MNPIHTTRGRLWAVLALLASLLFFFLGERVATTDTVRLGFDLPALALLAGALGWRMQQRSKSHGAARQAETSLAMATFGIAFALILYALSTDWGIDKLGLEGESADRVRGVLSALWISVLIVSVGAQLFMELAYMSMPIAEAVELRRIQNAAASGISLGLVLVFAFSINYVAHKRDVTRDLSYFRTTEPSETTLRMVSALREPVKVYLIYPRVNEVLDQLQPYFRRLDAESDQLTVEVRDHALAPELARRHRINGNGFVVLVRGEGDAQQAENFQVGRDLEAARSSLRTLDGHFQEKLAALMTRPSELHLTVGHRERSNAGEEGDAQGQRVSRLGDAMRRSNIENRPLGMAQGLASRVPEGARAVAVIGPRSPFLPEEAESLLRYVREGGRLFVMVDPDVDHGLTPLFQGLGVEMREGVVHSEREHLRGPPPGDREMVYSNQYSSHPTATLANRFRNQIASIFARGGVWRRYQGEGVIQGINVTFPVRTGNDFWLDLDNDHERDENEPIEHRLDLIAAVTVPVTGGEEGRAVLIADGDFVTDQWIANEGNSFILMDSLQWLVGGEQVFGPTQTEEDVPIQHTADEDRIWFWGTSLGAPLPLLIIGILMGWRRYSRSGPSKKKKPTAVATAAAPPEADDDDDDDDPEGSEPEGSEPPPAGEDEKNMEEGNP